MIIENNKNTLNKKDIETIFNGKIIKGHMFKNYSKVFFFPKECMELDLYRKKSRIKHWHKVVDYIISYRSISLVTTTNILEHFICIEKRSSLAGNPYKFHVAER